MCLIHIEYTMKIKKKAKYEYCKHARILRAEKMSIEKKNI